MKVSTKERRIIAEALEHWCQQGKISAEQQQALSTSMEVQSTDWTQIARYSFWVAIACIVFAIFSVLLDEWLIGLLQEVFSAPDLVKSGFFAVCAGLLFILGMRGKARNPDKTLSNEALFVVGIITTAVAIFFLGDVIQTNNLAWLILIASVVYGLLGLWIRSQLVWGAALLTLACWFGLQTYYLENNGAFLGMNYPLRYALFGLILTVAGESVFNRRYPAPAFELTTKAFGLIFLFCSLWLLSVFGNFARLSEWEQVRQLSLLHWSVLLALASFAALYWGIRKQDEVVRGFGLAFVFINLYTRFFEYFWQGVHKAAFFAILAASFWFLGTRAEKIYHHKLLGSGVDSKD